MSTPLPLLEWDAIVVDSIYKAIRDEVISQGYMPDVDTFDDTEAEALRYQTAGDAIITAKGFEIEVFNDSSARRKGAKKSPRIVIYLDRTYAGEIGAPNHAIISNDGIVGGKYKSGFMPTKSAEIVTAIHLISSEQPQTKILDSILANVIGQRQYMFYWIYNETTKLFDQLAGRKFLADQTSFNNNDDALEGVRERIYFYTTPDIYLSGMKNTTLISPIKYIDVKSEDEDPFTSAGTKTV